MGASGRVPVEENMVVSVLGGAPGGPGDCDLSKASLEVGAASEAQGWVRAVPNDPAVWVLLLIPPLQTIFEWKGSYHPVCCIEGGY